MRKFTQLFIKFLPLLFALCGLFAVNESAWATWPTYSGSVSTPDNGKTYYVLYEGSSAVELMNGLSWATDKEYSLGGPGAEVTFDLQKTSNIATGSVYVYAGNTEIKSVGIGSFASKNNWKSFSDDMSEYCSTETSIKFHASGTLTKKVRYAKVKMFSGVLQPKNAANNANITTWTYTAADYAAENSYKDFTVDWSNLASLPLSKAVNGSSDDRSQFSYEIFSNTKTLAKGNYGTATIRVKYKHDKVGTHSVKINVGDYSITFTGTTNKITPYIVTTPTVDTITYGQTISNSQLGTGLVKADLINAAGTVVPGTWTVNENGQTVTTSGGSNATVHLTFTPTDGNTYNTIHTTQSMFVRSVATISWASAYSAEKPTVPVGKWIENAATTNAAGAVITYSSTSPDVEISADGKSFRFTAESEAEVVASHGVTATHGSASETKTFKSTYKAIQVIKWADRFDRLTTEMTSKSLIAEVWIENALTGVRTPSAERTALLQYSSANSSIVSISVNSTTLRIEGKGTTTITAFVEGDEYYEEASVTMPVKVREPSDGCDYPLWEKDHEGDKDHLYEFFQMNKDEIISPEYDIRMEGQYPDKLSFGHKGEYYNVVGISFWKYYSGPIKAQQKIGNNWQDVQGSVVTPAISDWGETSDLQLDERATHIRFVRPQGGEGHHYIKNVTVSRKHFIRTETPEVDFGNTIKVNSSEYRDVVINYANVQDVLKVTNPFSQDITVDDVIDVDSCGAAGSAVLRIYFSPTSLATVDDYITIRDEVKNSTLSIHVKADAQRADQTITWNPATSISTIDQILLNGTTNGQEYGQMNVIGYEVTNNDGVISVTNNVVTILKPGTVTITASQNGSTNYAAATQVVKNFTISAEPLTLTAPVADNITYGQALSASELTGGSAKDSKNNTVDGTFAWQTPTTVLNAGDNQTQTVVFTPSTNAAWYTNLTTTANINVAKADPVVTVENVSFAYGTKAEDVSLSGTGAGTWTWTDSRKGQVLAVDTYEMDVHFAPTDDANYNAIDKTITLTVTKANPAATVENVSFAYGTRAEDVALSGTGAGTWTWTDSRKGQVLAVDTYEMDVHFAPTDDANYNAIDKTITLTVTKADPAATVENVSFAYGTKAEDVSLSGTGAGTWTWTDSRKGQTLTVGEYEMDVHFAPTDGDNYNAIDTKITLTVNKIETLQVPVVLSFCAGGSEEYRGVTYTEAGTYPVNAEGANRDTVYNVIVTVLQPTTGTDSKTITYGENESWHGTDLSGYTAGEHEVEYHTTNAVGCDSTVTLSLTVNKATPTLSWETAPAELAYNATDVVYAATSTSNEGDITYSITSGSEYAEINANTGVLTNIVPGHNITVQATQAVSTNYNAPVAITVNVTIAAIPTNTFTNAHGDNDWQNDENWSSGSVPTEEAPNVIVSGALSINESITVGNLTIENTGSIAVITGGTLTVKGTSEYREAGYGDVHVLNDGAIHLGNSADLQVRHFTLDAKLGDADNAAASGQVSGDDKLNVNGDAYFKMSFDVTGQITYGWYDFVVPFEVDAMNGVFDANGVKIVYGTDYIIMNHSEEKRARNQKAWNTYTGTLEPGRIYTITFEETKTWNTFLFKKKAGSDLVNSGTYTSDYSSTIGESQDRGWNGFGNGTLQHRELTDLTGISKVQMYNHTLNRYDAIDEPDWNNTALAVGTAFSIQVQGEKSIVLETADAEKPLRAPSMEARTVDEFYLTLTDSETEKIADRLWVSASEEATGEYVIGHDLLKMGTPTQAKTAQMWTTRDNMNLCDIEMPLVANTASTNLSFFAPKAGMYEIAIQRAPENAMLYLTYNGRAIWNLTNCPYVFDLTKGTTEGYGLRIYAVPQVTTDLEQSEFSDPSSVRKVLIDDVIYIITPDGKMYDITGKSVNY